MYQSVSHMFLLSFPTARVWLERNVWQLTVEIFIEDHEFYRLFPAFNVTVIKQICVVSVLTGDVRIT
jgi:hypothetical protein